MIFLREVYYLLVRARFGWRSSYNYSFAARHFNSKVSTHRKKNTLIFDKRALYARKCLGGKLEGRNLGNP